MKWQKHIKKKIMTLSRSINAEKQNHVYDMQFSKDPFLHPY